MPCNFNSLDVKKKLAALAKNELPPTCQLPITQFNLQKLNEKSPNHQSSIKASQREKRQSQERQATARRDDTHRSQSPGPKSNKSPLKEKKQQSGTVSQKFQQPQLNKAAVDKFIQKNIKAHQSLSAKKLLQDQDSLIYQQDKENMQVNQDLASIAESKQRAGKNPIFQSIESNNLQNQLFSPEINRKSLGVLSDKKQRLQPAVWQPNKRTQSQEKKPGGSFLTLTPDKKKQQQVRNKSKEYRNQSQSPRMDFIIRESVKRELEKKRRTQKEKEDESLKRKELKAKREEKNKAIREENWKKQQEISRLKSQNLFLLPQGKENQQPAKREKTPDQIAKKKSRERQRQKERQEHDKRLGLEIFQIQKEMGLKSHQNSIQAFTERSSNLAKKVFQAPQMQNKKQSQKELDVKQKEQLEKYIKSKQKQRKRESKIKQTKEKELQHKMAQNLSSIQSYLKKSAEKGVGVKRFSTLASQRQESPQRMQGKVTESVRQIAMKAKNQGNVSARPHTATGLHSVASQKSQQQSNIQVPNNKVLLSFIAGHNKENLKIKEQKRPKSGQKKSKKKSSLFLHNKHNQSNLVQQNSMAHHQSLIDPSFSYIDQSLASFSQVQRPKSSQKQAIAVSDIMNRLKKINQQAHLPQKGRSKSAQKTTGGKRNKKKPLATQETVKSQSKYAKRSLSPNHDQRLVSQQHLKQVEKRVRSIESQGDLTKRSHSSSKITSRRSKKQSPKKKSPKKKEKQVNLDHLNEQEEEIFQRIFVANAIKIQKTYKMHKQKRIYQRQLMEFKKNSSQKQPKHTFSFGNIDQQKKHQQQQSIQDVQKLSNDSDLMFQHPDVFGKAQDQFDTSQSKHIIVEALTDNLEESSHNSKKKEEEEEEEEEEKKEEEKKQEEEKKREDAGELEDYFKVDDRLQYALRSLAEKQKQKNQMKELIKKKKQQAQDLPFAIKHKTIESLIKPKREEEEEVKESIRKQKTEERKHIHYISDSEHRNYSSKNESSKIDSGSIQQDVAADILMGDQWVPIAARQSKQEDMNIQEEEEEEKNDESFVNQQDESHIDANLLSSTLMSGKEALDEMVNETQTQVNETQPEIDLLRSSPNFVQIEEKEEVKQSVQILGQNISKSPESFKQALRQKEPFRSPQEQKHFSFQGENSQFEIQNNESSLENKLANSQTKPLYESEQVNKSRFLEDSEVESQRAFARMLVGDERKVKEIQGEIKLSARTRQNEIVLSARGLGSPTSLQKTESDFMQTNCSIFDRNPFKDFTTNKLTEILNAKDQRQLQEMREEALLYGEKLERKFIKRLESKNQLSPNSIQKRKFELEKWVNVEKKQIQEVKYSEEGSYNADIEKGRQEAIDIITKVNLKADEIQGALRTAKPQVISRYESGPSTAAKQEEFKALEPISLSPLGASPEDTSSPEKTRRGDQESGQGELEERKLSLEISFENEEDNLSSNLQAISGRQQNALQREKQANEITEHLIGILLSDVQEFSEQLQPKFKSETLEGSKKKDIQEFVNEKFVEQQQNSRQAQIQRQESASYQTSSYGLRGNQIMGIRTDTEVIIQYAEEIFHQIQVRREQFMNAFYTPICKNPFEILYNLQRMDVGDFEMVSEESTSMANILNVDLYLTLEKAREELFHEAIEAARRETERLATNEEEITELVAESEHIHNKAIFDSVNEALNLFRPYGPRGEPMPWSSKSRKNGLFLSDSEEALENVLTNVKMKLAQWANTRAGALPLIKESQETNQTRSDLEDDILQHHREKVLSDMLGKELKEMEEKFTDYEMLEAQTKIDLGDAVLEHLVKETVEVLQNLEGRQFN